ncbi:MAG: SufE family protein [Ginsengibacter sp.]
METEKIQDRIIEEFEGFSNSPNRCSYFRKLVEAGNVTERLPAAELDNKYLVQGRKSEIWIKGRIDDGKVFYIVYSKNHISKGLAGLLFRVFSGRSPKEIINTNLYFLDEIKLFNRISSEWLQDLLLIMKKIKSQAAALQLKRAARGVLE